MTIAISGTRQALTHADEAIILGALVPYFGQLAHIGDCPTGVDRYVDGRFPDTQKFIARGAWPAAGPIRNGRMLQGAVVLIAFPGPKSRGTLNTIEQAIRRGIETHVYPIGRP